MDSYKVEQLKKMLVHETSKTETHYGAHLSHWYGDSKELTIDAGGLKALIRYYSRHDTDLGDSGNSAIAPDAVSLQIRGDKKMANKLKQWRGHTFSSYCDTGEDYLAFQKDARADLRKQAAAAGYTLHKFYKNHYCFSAVLQHKETGSYVYVSIDDVRCGWRWYEEVLYRTMAHEKAWTGGQNHFCTWDGISAALSELKMEKS